MLTHTGEKPHKCSVYAKQYTQASNLKRHLLTRASDLKHIATHTGEKPQFTQGSNLNVHMLTHTRDKPHACNVCDKQFTRANNLKLHMLTHTRDKPHACKVCDKQFTGHRLRKYTG